MTRAINTMMIRFCTYGFLKNLKFYEPFLIIYYLAAGMTYTQIGILISVREVTANLFEIPSGLLSDMYSHKKTLILCFISYIISFAVISVSKGFYMFIPGMFFYGIGEAMRSGNHKAIIFSWIERQGLTAEKADVYSTTRAWAMVGSAVSAIISGAIVFYNKDTDNLFLFSIIPYTAGLLLVLTYPEYRNYRERKKTVSHARDFLRLFRNRSLLRYTMNASIYEAYFTSIKDFIQPVLFAAAGTLTFLAVGEERRSAFLIGSFYFTVFIISAFVSKNSRRITRTVGLTDASTINISWLLILPAAVSAGVTAHKDSISGIFMLSLSVILLYIVYNIRKPVMVSMIGHAADSRHRAGVFSSVAQIKTLFTAVFFPVLGFLCDFYGVLIGMLLFSGLFILLIPLLFIRSKN